MSTNINTMKTLSLAIAATSLGLVVPAVNAQQLEEAVITAQKHEQSLQDTHCGHGV